MVSFRELKDRNEGARVLLDESTLENMKAKRMAEAQKYLDRLGNIHNEDQTYLLAIVREETTRVGARNVDLEACRTLAQHVTETNRRKRWEDVKALFKSRGIKDCPEDYEWAARQSGVELFDQPAIPLDDKPKVDAPRLVTE